VSREDAGAAVPAAGAARLGQPVGARGSSSSEPIVIGRALIKTAAVSLRSTDVSSVLDRIDQLVAHDGGFIASEDTSTDSHGVAVRSQVQLSVPSSDFGSAYAAVASYGALVSKNSSARDVTSQVVDVDSRVKSARDSIARLRLLFSRAEKLGDVIALESELAQREADLEALQAQQRDLTAHTTMSTITVDVASTVAPVSHESAGGFLSGIREGWRALVTFVQALSHGVGLILPLAVLALLAGLVTWVAVRRFTPRRPPRTSE
jgi:hypothetical protein